MTREEFKEEAKKVIDTERYGILGALFEYESFEEMKVAHIPNDSCSAESDMPLDDFLDKLYERIHNFTAANVIPIPEGATNGDMIKAMFPDELLTSITSTLWWGDNMSFNKDWWNAPYRIDAESEGEE